MFDLWVKEKILKGYYEALIDYKSHPSAKRAVPTSDHYYPLLYVLGAVEKNDEVRVFNEVRTMGWIAMTSYVFSEKDGRKTAQG